MKNVIEFKDRKCNLEWFRYSSKNYGFRLIDVSDGFPVANCTLNVPGAKLSDDEFIIKDYSENQGLYIALREADVIDKCNRTVTIGYNKGFICKIQEEWTRKK